MIYTIDQKGKKNYRNAWLKGWKYVTFFPVYATNDDDDDNGFYFIKHRERNLLNFYFFIFPFIHTQIYIDINFKL